MTRALCVETADFAEQIAWLMAAMGHGPALAAAKLAAGSFGVALHLSAVHKAVAVLAGFYLVVAVIPWAVVLLWL